MLNASEVAKHDTRESCWVIIEGQVYDVTDFLDEHPGGPSIILRYGGKDATEEYLPVHPPGTIENELPKEKHLGTIDPATLNSATVQTNAAPKNKPSPTDTIPIALCLNLHDLEKAAKKVLSKRGWTYYSSASDDLLSHHGNLSDWNRITFRPRVLRNVKTVSMKCNLLGHQSNLPFFIAPAALARLGHADGELCLARGASRFNIPYGVSTASSVSAEDLAACMQEQAAGGCLWFQLYVKKKESETRALIRRARSLGFKALLITVDTPVVGKREDDDRHKAEEALAAGESTFARLGDNVAPGEDFVLRGPFSSTLNWDDLAWMKDDWGNAGPICLKGIATAEDAKMASDLGFENIYLSNHGGRQLDSVSSSLRTLLEIRKFCPEVFDRCQVFVDGGCRRGSDVLKALCLGATAVGFGRPFMYALSAYGTEGVLKAIQMISDELETTMRLLGVTDLSQLRPHMVNTRELDSLIMTELPDFDAGKAKL
ncbi:putative cytochrome B2 [Lophium mytilinum]|uniref:L-lactate dehydrogenase (cytochrome) n=1 Tax=Lophium mytilinum TaxID=390894 RepID=A0A6A6QQE8_9PEZI|nr:putative cytochrome B2 [Lophium mytilinum]